MQVADRVRRYRVGCAVLLAAATALWGCGSTAQTETSSTATRPDKATSVRTQPDPCPPREVGTRADCRPPTARPATGQRTDGPYRFVHAPVVVKWANREGKLFGYELYFRLNRLVPMGLTVSIDGDQPRQPMPKWLAAALETVRCQDAVRQPAPR